MPDAPAVVVLLGRLHVVLVHFPVALLIVAAALAFWPSRHEGHAVGVNLPAVGG